MVSIIEPDDSIDDVLREARSLQCLAFEYLIVSATLCGTRDISLIQQLRSVNLTTSLIFTTDIYDREIHTKALALGATEAIEKNAAWFISHRANHKIAESIFATKTPAMLLCKSWQGTKQLNFWNDAN